VLDFGLARIAEDDLGAPNQATRPGTIQGTVPYMSPEQVQGRTDRVDVRSDVYALGVILYEMLAGQLPYDLSQLSLLDAAKVICEQPPRPLRHAAGEKFPVSHDLEVIVNKALEKDPERRYQSAAALAEDIRRSLSDQPILAQPPSTTYQVRKLVARHKLGFGFAVVVAVLLVGFAVSMAVAARRIASQRDLANREAQVAEQESGFLTNLFQSSRPEQARGKIVTARELLDRGAASIQSNRAMNPEVKASLLDTMGASYSSLGFFAQSQPLLEASLAASRALHGAQSTQVAATLRDLGHLALNRGDTAHAYAYYTQALAMDQRVEGASNPDVAKLYNDIGSALASSGKLAQAQPYFQKSLALTTQIEGPNSKSLIAMRSNLAIIAYSQKDYAGAEQQFSQELALAKRVYGPDHPNVAKITNNLGAVLFTEQKYPAAEAAYAAALALNRKLLGDKHPEVAVDLENLGEARDAQGELPSAEQAYRQALAILQPQVPSTDHRLRFAETNLGSVLTREGGPAQLQQAELLLRAALAADEKAAPKGSWDTADAQSELGGCLLAQGKLAAAQPLLVNSLPVLRAKLGANDPAAVTRALQRLVTLYQRRGNPAPARQYAAL
ncbi:MAG: tetratricopeptide repeat protein, partial [Terriglobales bacterium]